MEYRLSPYWTKTLRGAAVTNIFTGGFHNFATDSEFHAFFSLTKPTIRLRKTKSLLLGMARVRTDLPRSIVSDATASGGGRIQEPKNSHCGCWHDPLVDRPDKQLRLLVRQQHLGPAWVGEQPEPNHPPKNRDPGRLENCPTRGWV